MLICSKILFIASCVFLYLISVIPKAYVYFFIGSELFSGIAGGVGNVFRTYVAMASTEADRGKAYGIMQFSAAAGIILGPALQLGFSQISYPGLNIFSIIYINLFTAPIFLAIITSFFGIFLFLFCFDGKIWLQMPANSDKPSEVLPSENNLEATVNKLTVFVLILTKMVLELINIIFSTIGAIYAMAAFQLTSSDTIKLQSLMMALIGLLSVIIGFAYVFLKLNTRSAIIFLNINFEIASMR